MPGHAQVESASLPLRRSARLNLSGIVDANVNASDGSRRESLRSASAANQRSRAQDNVNVNRQPSGKCTRASAGGLSSRASSSSTVVNSDEDLDEDGVAPAAKPSSKGNSQAKRTGKRRKIACDAGSKSECDEELARREKALAERERELERRERGLRQTEARRVLGELERYFLCPLCYDPISTPYTLAPRSCGHTFCAACILRWFFSRLHELCAGWHERVECPMCRAQLAYTPERTPRGEGSFPFVPARMVGEGVSGLVGALTEAVGHGHASEGALVDSEKRRCGGVGTDSKDCAGDRDDTDGLDDAHDGSLRAWAEGGPARADWLRKQEQGKLEMEHLFAHWATMTADDFVRMKRRLGV